MTPRDRPGLLLVNLGTPASFATSDVRVYLREFLSDPRVIDLPAWRRWIVLNLFILPFRPRRSAEAYRKVWTERGSPLLFHGLDLTAKVRERLGGAAHVELAMRYGRPSIAEAMERLRGLGARRIVVFPLYPQYSAAATGSTLERVFLCAGRPWDPPFLQVVPPFFDHPAFLRCWVRLLRPRLERLLPEVVYFSFHGLPERQLRRSDEGVDRCLRRDDCCAELTDVNRHCYRAQCFATARLLAERLDLAPERYRVCFQSRLGRTPWIGPFTDRVVEEEARAGRRTALILSPAFVADCLETLEELGIRAVDSFRAAGGGTLELVPCLNADDAWADAVVRIAREAGLDGPTRA